MLTPPTVYSGDDFVRKTVMIPREMTIGGGDDLPFNLRGGYGSKTAVPSRLLIAGSPAEPALVAVCLCMQTGSSKEKHFLANLTGGSHAERMNIDMASPS